MKTFNSQDVLNHHVRYLWETGNYFHRFPSLSCPIILYILILSYYQGMSPSTMSSSRGKTVYCALQDAKRREEEGGERQEESLCAVSSTPRMSEGRQ